MIEASGVDIAETYDEYFKVGVALFTECGESGREYYHRICFFHSDYDEKDCDSQFDSIIEKGYNDVTKGTIIHYMKQKNLI